MKPIEQAKAHYLVHNLDFEQDLGWYLLNGYVFNTPDQFLMFKPIDSSLGEKSWFPANPDAWYVHYAAGKHSLFWFINKAPYELPKIAWMRNKGASAQQLKVYDSKRLYDRLAGK
jgi:hypothetical protein